MTEPPPLTAETIRAVREEAGLSQAGLAEISGLSRGTVQLIESGGPITPRSARLLRKALAEFATPRDRIDSLADQVEVLRSRVDQLASRGAA